MKPTIITFAFMLVLLMVTVTNAQDAPRMDKSPLDFAYMPYNYPHDGGDKLIGRVIYSRPAKNDREIFGKLIKYDKVWRLGANEATEITFYQDVTFGEKKVKAGTYSLFVIPGEKSWTFIVSSQQHLWGAYSYDKGKDVARTEVKTGKTENTVENLSIKFTEEGEGKGALNVYWDDVHVAVPIAY